MSLLNTAVFYLDGFNARRDGKSCFDCPYKLGTAENKEWLDGYHDALRMEMMS